MTTAISSDEETTITRELVPEHRRADVADAHFGIAYPLQLEPMVFAFASRLSQTYSGSYWTMYELSNGGYLMVPDEDGAFAMRCENGYEGSMTADAFGVTVLLYALSHGSFVADPQTADVYARHYHLLRYFAAEHAEAAAIFAAID